MKSIEAYSQSTIYADYRICDSEHFSLIILQIGNQIFQCIGDKAAAFLGYTNAGATMVYGSLVDSNYLNSLAIRNFNWNSSFVPEDQVETLAYIAEGLDQGV